MGFNRELTPYTIFVVEEDAGIGYRHDTPILGETAADACVQFREYNPEHAHADVFVMGEALNEQRQLVSLFPGRENPLALSIR